MGYNIAAWSSFFMAVSAASGVLLGLMITVITVRMTFFDTDRIRAREAYLPVSVLFFILIYALIPLAPIGRVAIGIALAVIGGYVSAPFVRYIFSSSGPYLSKLSEASSNDPLGAQSKFATLRNSRFQIYVSLILLALGGPCLLVVAGITLVIRRGGGLYWAVPGILYTLGVTLNLLWDLLMRSRATRRGVDRDVGN